MAAQWHIKLKRVLGDGWSCGHGRAGDGRPGRGAVQLPLAGASPSPRPPPAPHRPIAKFNAKVMRARVRLRAAMQERRRQAAGSPSVPHQRSRYTPHRNFPPSTRSNGSPDWTVPFVAVDSERLARAPQELVDFSGVSLWNRLQSRWCWLAVV